MIMGEAKRREELGLPPRQKNFDLNKSDRYLSWLPITKFNIKKISLHGGSYHGTWSDYFFS